MSAISKQTKSAKAGLSLSVARVGKQLCMSNPDKNCGEKARVYLAGAMENLAYTIMEMAADNAHESGFKRINTTDLIQAIRSDPDLSRAFSGFAFTSLLPANKAIDHILPMGGKDGQRERRKRIKAQKAKLKEKKAAARTAAGGMMSA
jgi:histone H3/H4